MADNGRLIGLLNTTACLELAIMISRRSTDTARLDSDWDFAIQWSRELDFVQQLSWISSHA